MSDEQISKRRWTPGSATLPSDRAPGVDRVVNYTERVREAFGQIQSFIAASESGVTAEDIVTEFHLGHRAKNALRKLLNGDEGITKETITKGSNANLTRVNVYRALS